MLIISHRGNLKGPNPSTENTLNQINKCIDFGLNVEIDVWVIKSKLYLGHDNPVEEITLDFLDKNLHNLWIHCKNFNAIELLSESKLNYFWHENDRMTLTSKGIPWCYPNFSINNGISVITDSTIISDKNILGICTDYPLLYKNSLESR